MFEQKSPDGDDAEQRVQLAPDEAGSLPRAQWLHAAAELWRGRGFDGCHEEFGSWKCGAKQSYIERLCAVVRISFIIRGESGGRQGYRRRFLPAMSISTAFAVRLALVSDCFAEAIQLAYSAL